MSFQSLPFDVLFAICQAANAQSNRGVHKSLTLSSPKVIGRRVVANSEVAPDSLLALSRVNKLTRDASEPLLFGSIVFGAKWEARGELRWAIAKARMKAMIQKQSLRHIVKSLVWDCSSSASWDTIGQFRPRFWATFAKLMQHLDHIDSVELGFWSQMIDPYPESWQDRSARLTREQLITHWTGESNNAVVKRPQRVSLLGCIPCMPVSDLVDAREGEPLNRNPYTFPNIKTARLRRGSRWFAAHCPNLEHVVDTGFVKVWRDFDVALLARSCVHIRTMDTLLVASPELITEVLGYFPVLEKLILLAPAPGRQLEGWRVQDMAPLFAKAQALRSLEFSRPTFQGFFPLRGEQFRELLVATAAAFAEQSAPLRFLKLGEFEFTREGPDEPFCMNPFDINAPVVIKCF